MNEESRILHFTIPRDLSQLYEVRQWIGRAGEVVGLDCDRLYDLRLVASEICANAIEHAKSDVRLMLWLLGDRLLLEVSSRGGFGARASERECHYRGMGLPIVISLVDELYVLHPTEDETLVAATFLLDEAASPDPVSPTARSSASSLELERMKARAATDQLAEYERAAITLRAELEAVLDEAEDALTVAELPDFAPLRQSRGVEALTGRTRDEMGAFSADDQSAVWHLHQAGAAHSSSHQSPLVRAAREGHHIENERWCLSRPDGEQVALRVDAKPFRSADGTILGGLATWRIERGESDQE